MITRHTGVTSTSRRSALALGLGLILAGWLGGAEASPSSPLASSRRVSYKSFRAELKASMSPAEWDAFRKEPLELHSMRERWQGEDKPGFVKDDRSRRPIDYLHSERERTPFVLTIAVDGRAHNEGVPFDTQGELVNAVAGPDHRFYADTSSVKPTKLNLKHSSFLAGQPAVLAIETEFKRGVARRFTNRSGHYRMKRREFAKGLLHLEAKGLDMSELEIEFDPKSE